MPTGGNLDEERAPLRARLRELVPSCLVRTKVDCEDGLRTEHLLTMGLEPKTSEQAERRAHSRRGQL